SETSPITQDHLHLHKAPQLDHTTINKNHTTIDQTSATKNQHNDQHQNPKVTMSHPTCASSVASKDPIMEALPTRNLEEDEDSLPDTNIDRGVPDTNIDCGKDKIPND
ncbi:hypothetical protein PSTT_03146, partial [Puccinia striiformis]